MRRKYLGDKKSIEARTEDRGRTWSGSLFEGGSETRFRDKSLAELEALVAKHGMRLVPN